MNSPRLTRTVVRRLLAVAAGIVFLASAAAMNAQVQTKTAEEHGPATKEVTVERGEVVLVNGNDLVVKMEDGSIRHIANVPESARAEVDGKQLGIHDLKPGMKLQRTITTTTTPKTITTVQTVTRQSLARKPAQYRDPDLGGRHESAIQDSQRPEVYGRWTADRCFRPEKGNDDFRY